MNYNYNTSTRVFCMGVWDVFHYGHLRLLQKARKLGDYLYVGIVDDLAVKKQKGENRPQLPLNERIKIIRSLEFVYSVIVLKDFNPLEAFVSYASTGDHIDIYVRGEDQTHIDLSSIIKKYDPIIVTLNRTEGISSSKIINNLGDK